MHARATHEVHIEGLLVELIHLFDAFEFLAIVIDFELHLVDELVFEGYFFGGDLEGLLMIRHQSLNESSAHFIDTLLQILELLCQCTLFFFNGFDFFLRRT